MRNLILLAVLAILAIAVQADVPGDLITNLPGLPGGTTPTKQYSGWLQLSADKFFHYWFVYSANNPATDPVTLWLNGGPGCSSLDGFFYENGPFKFTGATDGTGLPILYNNPNSWHTVSNMLYLESPTGVGFSYSNNPNDYSMNDNQTAADNWKALTVFFCCLSRVCY
jgi:carboxypeptidase C (cathepsin A)